MNELVDGGFVVVSEQYTDRVAAEHDEYGPADAYLKSKVRAQAREIRRLERQVEELRGRLVRQRRRAEKLEGSNRSLAAQVERAVLYDLEAFGWDQPPQDPGAGEVRGSLRRSGLAPACRGGIPVGVRADL